MHDSDIGYTLWGMINSEYTLLKICVKHCLDEEWVLSPDQKEILLKWMKLYETEGERLNLLTEEQEEDQDPDEVVHIVASIPVVGHARKENPVPSVLQGS